MNIWRSFQKQLRFTVSMLSLLCVLFSTLPGEGTMISKLSIPSKSSRKEVALTIDDGPHPGYTERILSLLAEHEVKASFFLVGKMAATYPYLVRKIASQGHTIANHSHYHNNLVKLPPDNMPFEWIMCNSTLYSILGTYPRFCRPPGGNYNQQVVAAAAKEGLRMVLWTANAGDCTGISAKTIEQKVVYRTQPGGIILIHDGVEATIEALPHIIKQLRKKGFTFVTLDQAFPEATIDQPVKASSKTTSPDPERGSFPPVKETKPSFPSP